ncbi:uncharacterized protein EI97DRAFT_464125 [Westerdykella ornata]|uniref:Uncharacterized protein n=1 Tax=Westerdykella ornata TaxID=318751 RepID=A0A6A6JWA6_WESOR|nr:uncharacterized protein EI97DRAFT_464125 [Westerdykella ornata]KAF2280098.1 hypothetical protein EI97DRAFT_464125 [Westerdykella ornata]
MKTDNYLTLCLEQAAKSPLHFRHGCIIVRGGKIIGQGYNDYRPGFNGGTVKSGRLPTRSVTSLHASNSKKAAKDQYKINPSCNAGSNSSKGTFTPFETTGSGVQANTPLFMHSEMMAIHSALSASTTHASSSLSSQKPNVKLQGGSKRKLRQQQQQALKVSKPKPQPTVITTGRPRGSTRSLSDRKKYPRLHGADLYVARLGYKSAATPANSTPCCTTAEIDIPTNPSPSATPHRKTGSLHEELTQPGPPTSSTPPPPATDFSDGPSVLASRPCYRCISCMATVGIKRVFWTTSSGAWEGAKVRDLVDAMDNLAAAHGGKGDTNDGSVGSSAIKDVFVTKHEVLKLRRALRMG